MVSILHCSTMAENLVNFSYKQIYPKNFLGTYRTDEIFLLRAELLPTHCHLAKIKVTQQPKNWVPVQ